MSKDLLIMFRDTPVLRINFDETVYEVLNESLLPWTIKGRFKPIQDATDAINIARHNDRAIYSWLSNRVLPLSRANAKWILNACDLPINMSDDATKVKVSLLCRSASLQDDYWVKLDGETVKWADVSIRDNHLNEIVAQVALHGRSFSLTGSLVTPELTTHGAYAKCWKREDDGLYLYKAGFHDSTESEIEVMVSNLLDKMNVNHLKYEAAESDGLYCCKCKCMSSEYLAILSGSDFYTYCNVHGLDFNREIMRIDKESILKMWVVDYLISNRDRHGQNWGFFYTPMSMEIIGCHPLYDHNNAFSYEYMDNPDAPYQFGGKSIREAAQYAINRVDVHFTQPIVREDFVTNKQYNTFMERAEELNIKTIKSSSMLDTVKKLDII